MVIDRRKRNDGLSVTDSIHGQWWKWQTETILASHEDIAPLFLVFSVIVFSACLHGHLKIDFGWTNEVWATVTILTLHLQYLLEKEMATHSSILAWKIPWTVHVVLKSQDPIMFPPLWLGFKQHNPKIRPQHCEMVIVSFITLMIKPTEKQSNLS